jgi:uncharacterized protein (TIGR00369 family)
MSWMDDEPVRGSYPDPALLGLSGLDRMKAGFRSQMPAPPIHHLFGLTPVSAGAASVTFSMPASPWLQSSAGVFFAGTSALVADAPLGGAVMAPLGPGKVVVTSDLSLNYLRPIDPSSSHLIARARPIEVGNRVGLAEGLIEDAHGKLVAHATTRCFVVSMDVPPLEGELPTVELPTYDTPDPYQRPLPSGSVLSDEWTRFTWNEILAMQQREEIPAPPFVRLFGMGDPEGGNGKFSTTMRATPWLTSPAATIYGGVLAYFADCAMAGAFASILDKNQIVASLDLKVQFVRPAWADGKKLRCEARVVHAGKTFAVAQAEIVHENGKTIALATSSATIISGRSWASFAVVDEAVAPSEPGPQEQPT